jgi:hypothetical protein
MWNKPWSLIEGLTIGGGLILVGVLLQFTIGSVNWAVFAYPVNIILLTLFVAVLILCYSLSSRFYAIRFLMSWKAAVPSLLFAVILTAIMGFTQQVTSESAPADLIGFTKMLSFWPFILIYVWLTVIIGLVAIRQMVHFRWKQFPSLVSHAGLFLVLVCGTLGSADMQRLKMYCEYGQPEWRALDSYQHVHSLDLAIQLNRFIMEEYKEDKMPKRFASEVEIMTKGGEHLRTTIEVNKPFAIDGWKIYQYGYDQAMGPMSRFSIFELVSDPWLPAVYTGFGLLCVGALGTFFTTKRKKEANV